MSVVPLPPSGTLTAQQVERLVEQLHVPVENRGTPGWLATPALGVNLPALASHPLITPRAQALIARDANRQARWFLADNPYLHVSVMPVLAQPYADSVHILERVGQGTRNPDIIDWLLANNPDPWVRRAIITNPNATDEQKAWAAIASTEPVAPDRSLRLTRIHSYIR